MAKRTTTAPRGKTSTKPKSKTPQRKSQPATIPFELSPQRQRELFALALITVALVTLVFYFSGSAGAVGQRWVEFTQRLLGWGSLLVPLSLGLLGIAILWQEQYEDLKFTGEMVVGTMLVIIGLLVLLEFAMGVRADVADRLGDGGGMIGYTLLSGFGGLFGRPAAFVIFCSLALAGVILTFNISPRALVVGIWDSVLRFVATIRDGVPMSEGELNRRRAAPALHEPRSSRDLAFVPPPGTDDDEEMVSTPIAARPTRASLFNRPETKKQEVPAAPAPVAAEPAKAKQNGKAKASDATVLTSLLNAPVSATDAPKPPPVAASTTPPPKVEQEELDVDGPVVHRAWPLPSFDALDRYASHVVSDDERKFKSRLIEETLASFKVEAQVVGVNTGPAVTQFEVQPAVGVKVSKITTLERDLALALAAPSMRIEAPIPGKSVIGIEIPNSSTSIVGMRDVMESEEFERSKYKLKLPLGDDVSGRSVVAGMERMPHLLVAGSTGSGKSVAVNGFICALLLKHTPDELKFIMVDPKMVELVVYNNIPHLLSPVVTELERVVPTLKWAVKEMERRYKVFAKHGFRNLDSYKQAARKRADLEPMPYIVIIIDELADLMMMAPDEVETLICRLAQMARATGIHLILATQRPSVDVVTGLIKANFPSRIAFAVTSQIDSRVILDMNGAEQLLGRGDMLYLAADAAKPIRVQGTFVDDREVERVVQFWRDAKPPEENQGSGTSEQVAENGKAAKDSTVSSLTPDPRPLTPGLKGPGEFLSVDEQEELLPEAIKLVQQHKRASASLLQRRLRIGYSKAAQLIELLEQQGIVGPAEDGRSREVLPQ